MRKRRFVEKLKSQVGESIAEVLIALLISSLALVMLASMISSTTSMVSTGKSAMKEYYACNEDLEKLTKTEEKTTKTEGVSITIKPASAGTPTNPSVEIKKTVTVYGNECLGKPVYSYSFD